MNVAIIVVVVENMQFVKNLEKITKKSVNIFCIPGNDGTSLIAKNIEVDFLKFSKLYKVLKNH